MTEAVKRQLAAHGVPQERRTAPAPSPVPPGAIGGREATSKPAIQLPTPAYADTVTNSATWLFDAGRLSVSLARPHGRQRLAIAGVPDEGLVAAVLGAIEGYLSLKNIRP